MKILLSGILLSLASVTAFAAPQSQSQSLPNNSNYSYGQSNINIVSSDSAVIKLVAGGNNLCSPSTNLKYTISGDGISFGSQSPGQNFLAKGRISGTGSNQQITLDTIDNLPYGCSASDFTGKAFTKS